MITEEDVQNLSDHVLQILAEEEDISDEFRIAVEKVRDSRPHTMVVLTSELLHNASSSGYCGWTRQQLAALGIGWPAKSGWLKRLVGKEVTQDQWRKFVSSKNHNFKKKR